MCDVFITESYRNSDISSDSARSLPPREIYQEFKMKMIMSAQGEEPGCPASTARGARLKHHKMNKPQHRNKRLISSDELRQPCVRSESVSLSATAKPPLASAATICKKTKEEQGKTAEKRSKMVQEDHCEGECEDTNGVPFNHYKRHTRLKRHIFDWRRKQLLRWEAQQLRGHLGPLHIPKKFNEDESNAEVPEITESRITARTEKSSALSMVHEMEALYGELDKAMKAGRIPQARALRGAIRVRRKKLQELLQRSPQSTADSLPDAELVTSTPQEVTVDTVTSNPLKETRSLSASAFPFVPGVYCSFYPDTTWLPPAALASLPSSTLFSSSSVERRTFQRHPVRLQLLTVETTLQQNPIDWEKMHQRHEEGGYSLVELQQQRVCWETALHAAATTTTTTEGKIDKKKKPTVTSKPRVVVAGPYTRNVLTDELDDLAFTTLQCLYEEQRTQLEKQPLLAKARQRYVIGFHETLKWLKAGRLQLVLLASDLEYSLEPEAVEKTEKTNEEGRDTETNRANGKPTNVKKTFHSISEAVSLVQRRCLQHMMEEEKPQQASEEWNVSLSAPGSKGPPLCLTCLSRHAMAYALMCKGRCQVGCVGVVKAEKHHYLLKALKSYGALLRNQRAYEVLGQSKDKAE